MIIPVQPVPVRISVSADTITNNGYVTPDLDIEKLIRDSESNHYELNICYTATNLYRTDVYQVNKSAKSITFFFMIGNDLYSAALTSSNGRCTFKKIPFGDQLPTVTSADAGHVLKVNSSGAWVAAPDSLPDPNAYDDGYLLTVVDDEWSIEPPSGGSLLVHISAVSTSQQLNIQAIQLWTAIQNGKHVLFYDDDNSYYTLYSASYSATATVKYQFVTTKGTSAVFKANTDTAYPVYSR